MLDIVIKTEHLGKKYIIGHQAASGRYLALRDVLMQNARGLWHKTKDLVQGKPIILGDTLEEVWALKDVSFEIQRGEALGIIGRNGAGKSTLLKILSRITEPSAGRVTIKGRVVSLLEVGTGFHPELTGRENVFLNGAILGMARAEIKRKFDEIVAFAEVEKFLDTPVKRYSSGMYVRLAFAVAAHLEPEILVVDEVLAVGDAAFQNRCLGKMDEVARSGRTVIFVSHNLGAISQFCGSAILLSGGRIMSIGDTAKVVAEYVSGVVAGSGRTWTSDPDERKSCQLVGVKLRRKTGEAADSFSCDEEIYIDLALRVRRRTPGLYGYLDISREDGTSVLVSDSFDPGENPLDCLEPGDYGISLRVPARSLGHGRYMIQLSFTSPAADDFVVDKPGIVASFALSDPTSQRGNDRRGFLSTLLSWETSALTQAGPPEA